MPQYLSAEWLDAFAAAAAGDDTLQRATRDVSLVIQQVVTGGAGGDVAFHVVVDHGTVRVGRGESPDATVTFSQDYETAAAVGRGELSAQGAFMTGRIRVHGDLAKLIDHQDAFGRVDDVFGRLRAETTY